MSQGSPPPPRPRAAEPPVDLGRLRIDRGAAPRRRVRGIPFLRLWILLGVAALAFLLRGPLLGLLGEGPAEGWETALAVREGAGGGVMANGYVVAERSASLSTVLSGRLVELKAKEGDVVEEGAVVARIESADLEALEAQAEAAHAAATARAAQAGAEATAARERATEAERRLETARLHFARLEAGIAALRDGAAQAEEEAGRLEREVARNRPLFEQRLIDSGEWDRLQTEARRARLALEAARSRQREAQAERAAWEGEVRTLEQTLVRARAEAAAAAQAEAGAAAEARAARHALDLAAIQVERTRIRAPFRGLVIRKDAEEGEVLAPTGAGNSRGSVFTIVDPSSLEMQVELSERRLAEIREGGPARIVLESDPQRPLAGRVRKVWPRADRSKGTVEVRVRFEPLPEGLKPDQAGRVEFLAREPDADAGPPAVRVPARAVVQRAGRSVVFVVRDGAAHAVGVRTGALRGTHLAVLEGLEGGERVVLSPPPTLADGAREP